MIICLKPHTDIRVSLILRPIWEKMSHYIIYKDINTTKFTHGFILQDILFKESELKYSAHFPLLPRLFLSRVNVKVNPYSPFIFVLLNERIIMSISSLSLIDNNIAEINSYIQNIRLI
jgi:hypothetical protein